MSIFHQQGRTNKFQLTSQSNVNISKIKKLPHEKEGKNMKKRATINNRSRVCNASRRRQLLKRVHSKVVNRRQQFQMTELTDEWSTAS